LERELAEFRRETWRKGADSLDAFSPYSGWIRGLVAIFARFSRLKEDVDASFDEMMSDLS
jgi:hypothetical protein